jgi:hypothetical protein
VSEEELVEAVRSVTGFKWGNAHVLHCANGFEGVHSGWVDVQVPALAGPGGDTWTWTVESSEDRDEEELDEDDPDPEEGSANWFVIDLPYDLVVVEGFDSVVREKEAEDGRKYWSPTQVDLAIRRVGEEPSEDELRAGEEWLKGAEEAGDRFVRVFGGWSTELINDALASWVEVRTGVRPLVEFDSSITLAGHVLEALAGARGEETFMVAATENGGEVRITSSALDSLLAMDPEAQEALGKAITGLGEELGKRRG